MRFFSVVLLAVVAAVAYGVVHDQVTVRVSLEYFTIGHPPVFATDSPTLLALGWGVLATWWVGLPLGFLLATATQAGRRHPPLSRRTVARLIGALLVVMAVGAAISGTVGYLLAASDQLLLPDRLAAAIPADRHDRFFAAWWSHGASYGVGIVGGLITVAAAWLLRRHRAAASSGRPGASP